MPPRFSLNTDLTLHVNATFRDTYVSDMGYCEGPQIQPPEPLSLEDLESSLVGLSIIPPLGMLRRGFLFGLNAQSNLI
jgi:hypothetical protein